MSTAAIHWKHNNAQGLRVFQTAEAAIQGGENPASLVSAGGLLIKWPGALGAPPDDAAIATWVAEYQAAVVDRKAVDDAEQAQAKVHPQILAMMDRTPAQIDNFVDNQVTNIAGVQAALKIILRMIVVLLRRSFR